VLISRFSAASGKCTAVLRIQSWLPEARVLVEGQKLKFRKALRSTKKAGGQEGGRLLLQ
jgi:hypothetical protein